MWNKNFIASISCVILTLPVAGESSQPITYMNESYDAIELADSLSPLIPLNAWTPRLIPEPHPSLNRLSENDYLQAARELGVEVATIKAVVFIEAGPSRRGFSSEEVPIVNFDLNLFRNFARRKGIALTKFKNSNPEVFAPLNKQKYGSIQNAQLARLHSAMAIDSIAAQEATFWGMFQIGGFNWKKCGCSSIEEYVRLMSTSERDQLELFVKFILSRKLERYLQAKNWAGFALRYNGKSYARHGYHKRLAKAYRNFVSKK